MIYLPHAAASILDYILTQSMTDLQGAGVIAFVQTLPPGSSLQQCDIQGGGHTC
jgi:hypothetical protein